MKSVLRVARVPDPCSVDDSGETPSVHELRARISQSDPSLDPGQPAFRAAVVLLAARYVGQNVDRLARYTRVAPGELARFARRLCDNGVWRGSRTHCLWQPDAELGAFFWADVEIALGRMCRRVSEGVTEWAPAGHWNKSYDFVSPAAASSTSVLYYDRGPEPIPSPPAALDPVDPPAAVDPMERATTERPSSPLPRPPRESPLGRGANAEIFPGATWLG
jgi:hypothetical protein